MYGIQASPVLSGIKRLKILTQQDLQKKKNAIGANMAGITKFNKFELSLRFVIKLSMSCRLEGETFCVWSCFGWDQDESAFFTSKL